MIPAALRLETIQSKPDRAVALNEVSSNTAAITVLTTDRRFGTCRSIVPSPDKAIFQSVSIGPGIIAGGVISGDVDEPGAFHVRCVVAYAGRDKTRRRVQPD